MNARGIQPCLASRFDKSVMFSASGRNQTTYVCFWPVAWVHSTLKILPIILKVVILINDYKSGENSVAYTKKMFFAASDNGWWACKSSTPGAPDYAAPQFLEVRVNEKDSTGNRYFSSCRRAVGKKK